VRLERSKLGIVERVRARRGRDAASAPALRPTARYGTNEAKTSVGFELETDCVKNGMNVLPTWLRPT
jgi:hypothetical protein